MYQSNNSTRGHHNNPSIIVFNIKDHTNLASNHYITRL